MTTVTLEEKIDSLARELHKLHVLVLERFPTRDELLEVSRDGQRRSKDLATVKDDVGDLRARLGVVEASERRMWGAVGVVGAAAVAAVITAAVAAVITALMG